MTTSRYPPGWDENRVHRVLKHYEAQSDNEAAAEDHAAYEASKISSAGPGLPQLGMLTTVESRQVWRTEARDFTPWLADNLAALGEALGVDLELIQREVPVGDFRLDILARDLGRDRLVIIESQLSPTDHLHFGQLITYAAGHSAGAVVWIAESIREDHRQALDWLNQHTDEAIDFFGVVVEAVRIDESRPAANFKLVAFPNEWRKRAAAATTTTERGESYRAFFQGLIDELRKRHFTSARTGRPQNWYSFPSGVSGVAYNAAFPHGHRVRAAVRIRAETPELSKRVFDALAEEKEAIEREFGEPLTWERLDPKATCRIGTYRRGHIEDDERVWEEIRQWLIDNLIRLKIVFGPRLAAVMSKVRSQRPEEPRRSQALIRETRDSQSSADE